MHENPGQDWHALTENYRLMLDGELEELAANISDLTDIAQQVLRNELRNRGLAEPDTKAEVRKQPAAPAGIRWASSVHPDEGDPNESSDRRQHEDERELDGSTADFTWKTPLCECDDQKHALALCEVLKKAGIESWYEDSASGWGISGPRVVVAADQLEEAREIATRPIPQEIVDFYRDDAPEYIAPKCPSCGTEDPVLESAEPSNSWLCEACGRQWTEPVADLDEQAKSSGR